MKKIKEQSGFGWDDTLKIATAPDDVWERYIAVSDHYLRLTALIFGANDAVDESVLQHVPLVEFRRNMENIVSRVQTVCV